MVERQLPGHAAIGIKKHGDTEVVNLHKQICRGAEHASAAAYLIKWHLPAFITGQKMRETEKMSFPDNFNNFSRIASIKPSQSPKRSVVWL